MQWRESSNRFQATRAECWRREFAVARRFRFEFSVCVERIDEANVWRRVEHLVEIVLAIDQFHLEEFLLVLKMNEWRVQF